MDATEQQQALPPTQCHPPTGNLGIDTPRNGIDTPRMIFWGRDQKIYLWMRIHRCVKIPLGVTRKGSVYTCTQERMKVSSKVMNFEMRAL